MTRINKTELAILPFVVFSVLPKGHLLLTVVHEFAECSCGSNFFSRSLRIAL